MISEGTNVWFVYIDGNGWVSRRRGVVQSAVVGADKKITYKLWASVGGGQDCYAKASNVFAEEDESLKAAVDLCDRLEDGLCNQEDRDAVVFPRG
jgi:hypothetical protein